MKRFLVLGVISILACQTGQQKSVAAQPNSGDPYIWLEQIQGPQVNTWVKAHNEISTRILMDSPLYKRAIAEARPIVTAKDRIPLPELTNGMIRNFWTDENHVRGLWRQTTPKDFENADPHWDTILDLDVLNKKENKSWVFEGANCLPPEENLCLVKLSDGGKDKAIVREFNVAQKSFVQGGFEVPEAKSRLTWLDKNTLFIGTDFGSDSLTNSGYPMDVRIWKRGTPLSDAKVVFKGKKEDVAVGSYKTFLPDGNYTFIDETPTFFSNKTYLYKSDGSLKPIPFPLSADPLGVFKGFELAKLREDWKVGNKTYVTGSVLALPLSALEQKSPLSTLEVLYTPDPTSTFENLSVSKNFMYLAILRNVRGEIYQVSRRSGKWHLKLLPLPKDGAPSIVNTSNFEDSFYVSYESFNVPPSLYVASGLHLRDGLKKVKELSAQFDASDIQIDQFHAESKDKTSVPYFVVHKKSLKWDGTNPTLLYAYGGFEISRTPFYSGTTGKLWLEKGGVYVLANIRGGGEFGPRWHEAALKTNRQRAYEDFFAVTQDLFTRQITTPRRLGIMGGSNGGLLMGVALTQHPEYYTAIVCESALLDMLRYTKLPPGASWIGEYGDPDIPEMAQAISKYSPYQNLRANIPYPQIFFHISTADDRVQPGHTRKMVARMEELGNDVLFYENTEGGHGGAADVEQTIVKRGLEFSYLYQKLMN